MLSQAGYVHPSNRSLLYVPRSLPPRPVKVPVPAETAIGAPRCEGYDTSYLSSFDDLRRSWRQRTTSRRGAVGPCNPHTQRCLTCLISLPI